MLERSSWTLGRVVSSPNCIFFEMDRALLSCLSSNIVSSVGWCVDIGASRHITYNRSLFSRFQEQEGGMCMVLGDDANYPGRGVGSISFYMPSSDVIFVLGLKNNLFSCLV